MKHFCEFLFWFVLMVLIFADCHWHDIVKMTGH